VNDERLREAYERSLPPDDGRRAPLDDVAAERLRRLVEREGDESERLRTLDTMLSSAEGRRELEIAWSAARAARPRGISWTRYAAAASIVVLLGAAALWKFTSQEDREATRGVESPVTLTQPIGDVTSADAKRFTWRRVAGAERYTLVVVDTSGSEIFASETTDTSVALPDSIRLRQGASYLWWVQAQRRDQSAVTAVTQRLTIKP
jgi:hypothetical protein